MIKPIIVSGYSSQPLAGEIARQLNAHVGLVTYKQFSDKEIKTTIEENIRGRPVIVIPSAAGDPNKQEKEARLLLRAAHYSNAASITLLIPYMWYGRADDNWDERNAPALTDTIEGLRNFCDSVIVADPHNSGLTKEKFRDGNSRVKTCLPVHFSYPFAVQLKHMFKQKALIPDRLLLSHADAGSTKRISRSFRAALYNTLESLKGRNPDEDDWAQGLKTRDKATNKSRVMGFSSDVEGMDVVIFEDMIFSGGTACDLAQFLKVEKQARSVTLFATNGLFTPKEGEHLTASIDRINNSAIDAVFITDTYDHRYTDPGIHKAIHDSPIIHVISTAPYLAQILNALHMEILTDEITNDNSLSAILRGEYPSQQGEYLISPSELKPNNPFLLRQEL